MGLRVRVYGLVLRFLLPQSIKDPTMNPNLSDSYHYKGTYATPNVEDAR